MIYGADSWLQREPLKAVGAAAKPQSIIPMTQYTRAHPDAQSAKVFRAEPDNLIQRRLIAPRNMRQTEVNGGNAV